MLRPAPDVTPAIVTRDLTEEQLQAYLAAPAVAIDTETLGLQLLRDRSPLHKADRICRPLLIGQGANDPRVKQSESDQIVDAMKKHGIPVTYVVFPDEGHGFQRPENQVSFFAVMEAFLAEHLDGRFEPIGDAFAGSSVEVREGASLVPGLADVKTAKPKED